MIWALCLLGGGYLAFIGALYTLQRRMTYAADPTPIEADEPALPGLRLVESRTDDGLVLRHLYRPGDDPAAPVLVHFHGNAGHAGYPVERFAWLARAGCGLLFAEYRGYGGNPGTPHEAGLFADARSVVARLRALGIAPERLVLYGESLGTGVAVRLAAELARDGRPVRGVVLEAPFSSLADTAHHHYWYTPAKWLIRERYDSARRIAGIEAPLLILHGTRDRTVPHKLGRRLFDRAAEPKQMLSVPDAGHTGLLDFREVHEVLRAFLAERGAPAARELAG